MAMARLPLQGQGTASPSQKELIVSCYKITFLLCSVPPSASAVENIKQVPLVEVEQRLIYGGSPQLNTHKKDAALSDIGSLAK